MEALKRIWALVTRKNLHRLVTFVGVVFAGFTLVVTWWGLLGLSTEGKIGVTIGILSTLAAGWKTARPKIDAAIDALPIPDDCDATANVVGTIVPATPLEAVPEAKKEVTPITTPIRPGNRGSASITAIVVIMVLATIGLFAALLIPAVAKAEPGDLPGTLGCFDQTTRNYCGRLVMPAGVGGLSLLRRTVAYGAFTGGLGLGVDLWARSWHTVTPAAAVAAKAEKDANFANVALLVGLCKVAWVGAMVHIDASLTEWSLLAGFDPITVVTMLKGAP